MFGRIVLFLVHAQHQRLDAFALGGSTNENLARARVDVRLGLVGVDE